MSPERIWKKAFLPGFNEDRQESTVKTGFTQKQKRWIRNAWLEVTGRWECQYPTWDGDKPRICGSERNIQIHHIRPRGFSKRVTFEDPDRATNAIPICEEHHILGQKNRPLDDLEQDVIHLDTAWARREYRGKKKPTSFNKMTKNRRGLAQRGIPYWNEKCDRYFQRRAKEVVSEFIAYNPDNKFPKKRK